MGPCQFSFSTFAIDIHYFEHDAQPKAFASIFHSMWWAAVTLTTVGYGGVYPITACGRIFIILVLFIGLGIIAIPTRLVGSAVTKLKDELEDERWRGPRLTAGNVC